MRQKSPFVSTFSIVAFDPDTNELGIAVQSKFLGVGAVVPWAKAGVGAVATQSFANTRFGPDGLTLLEQGLSPQEVVEKLIENDDARDLRQFAIIDASGNSAAYTGKDCYDWAGHRSGTYCSAQGNILVSEKTVETMVSVFEKTEGTLAKRLLEALDQGQAAGGDSRGKQSAALFIVQEEGGYGGYNDRKYDLRVDDHPDPIKELKRLFELHQLYFSRPNEVELLDMEGDVLSEVQKFLVTEGILDQVYGEYNEVVKDSLKTFYMQENFEERWCEDNKMDPYVNEFHNSLFKKANTLRIIVIPLKNLIY
ncbi:putative Ntn-hydrolase superfamily protein [Evansella vedderi]|uniref:Ntn-hydrolase superfamily protein n=1 Tax=Evansella vedderi TaxID=38282 RepID=A0ABU0A3S4_9BACI|nr:DUF1028 domain-containing protein [Evansella vedderi]MDQ0257005.1 putative Ntn-hydrolase superfamily protein [Evansella vedderi]